MTDMLVQLLDVSGATQDDVDPSAVKPPIKVSLGATILVYSSEPGTGPVLCTLTFESLTSKTGA